MKLLTRTFLIYLFITLALFTAGGAVFFYSLQAIIRENTSENLEQVREQVLFYVRQKDQLPPIPKVGSDLLLFLPTDRPVEEVEKDTLLHNSFEDEYLPYHQHVFSVQANGQWYKAIAAKPIVESEDLAESVVSALALVAGILLVVLILSNWLLSRSLWKPFYKTLEQLQQFKVDAETASTWPSTRIEEFKKLNQSLEAMTSRIRNDYRNLKEFTENASHELQTPLAIIRSKLELLIQSEGLTEEQIRQIQHMYDSVNRLTRLNQSLLLLTKIENRQFQEPEPIDLLHVMEKKVEQMEELAALRKITISWLVKEPCVRNMNTHLADILISNLLTNAIRHNQTGGKIFLSVNARSIEVTNTGSAPALTGDALFKRFSKAGQSSESTGLGLSILKSICDLYGFNIRFGHIDSMNRFTIDLNG